MARVKLQAPPRGLSKGQMSSGPSGGAPNGALYAPQTIRPVRRPWYSRKRLVWPLLYLLVAAGTCSALWWNVPVLNLLTGEHETHGTRVMQFAQNLIQPRASLDVAFSGQEQIRVLLVGLDHVPEKKGEEPPHRSDSVMVAATDFGTKQVRMLSIPRDSWIEQYQDGAAQGRDKLAHSYTYGGVQRTEETIEHLLGLDIDFYVTVKFQGLAQLIDTLGGLTVDVEKNMNYDDRRGNLHIHLKKGVQHLTGEEVVQYARFRHDAMSDIARMGRQQKVMQLLLAELMKPENITRFPQIAEILLGCVETNMSAVQLQALAQHAKEFSPEAIKTLTLNSFCNMGPGSVDVPGAPRGMSVQMILDPDVEIARGFITDLAPPPPPPPPETTGTAIDPVTGQPVAADEGTPAVEGSGV